MSSKIMYNYRAFDLLILPTSPIGSDVNPIMIGFNPGSGKSTLSGAFFNRGYSILADDICAINNEGSVLPSFPQIKLWADVAKKLIINTQTLKKIRPNVDKFALPLKKQFISSPFLSDHDVVSCTNNFFVSCILIATNTNKVKHPHDTKK